MTPEDRALALLTLFVLGVLTVLLAAVELLYLWAYLGTVPFPVTIVVAAVSTPWLVREVGELGLGRAVAAVPLLLWLLTVGVLALAGPGRDLLLPLDWRGLALLAAGLLPAARTLGRTLRRA